MSTRTLFSLAAACVCVLALSGCSLFGRGPKQHTTIDYGSIEPQKGHGADYDPSQRPLPKDEEQKQ